METLLFVWHQVAGLDGLYLAWQCFVLSFVIQQFEFAAPRNDPQDQPMEYTWGLSKPSLRLPFVELYQVLSWQVTGAVDLILIG